MGHKGRLRYVPAALRPWLRPPLDALRRGVLRSLQRLEPYGPSRIAATGRWLNGARRAAARRQREARLTVAVDIEPFWAPLTGVGWYLNHLLCHFADRDDLRLRLYGPILIGDGHPPVVALPTGEAIEQVTYPDLDAEKVVPGVRRLIPWLERRLLAADRNTVVFAPNFVLPERFRRARGRLVVTVHDLGFHKVGWTLDDRTRATLDRQLSRTVNRACRVITDSEAVRQEILELGMKPAEQVVAVHLGGGSEEAEGGPLRLPASLEPGGYYLHVGTLEPRKNVGVIVDAWEQWRAQRPQVPPLVLCGGDGWKSDRLRVRIAQGEAEGWVVRLGYVEAELLASLYRGARAVLLPSLYEGFGLPLVEAMAAGAPILCSDLPVLREVGGEAALYVADEPQAWVSALARFEEDGELRQWLVEQGSRRRELFDWGRTAAQTVDIFRQAAR